MTRPRSTADPTAAEELERFESDVLYVDQHRGELLARYPEQWVAIYHQQIVGAAREPDQLRAHLERQGIPPGKTHWEYLSTRAVPYQTTDQAVVEDLQRYEKDRQYLEQHVEELCEKYPDHWVAVYHQQVVGAAKHHQRLIAQLEREGIPPGRVYRQYLATKEELLIVAARTL